MDMLSPNEYHRHQWLWHLFPDAQKRPFLYRHEMNPSTPGGQWYLVSSQTPEALAGLNIETKPYNPQLQQGERLTFSLRANAVVARRLNEHRKSKKHDVMMDAKQRAKATGADKSQLRTQMEQAAIKWLVTKGDNCGFKSDPSWIRLNGDRQRRVLKEKSTKPIQFTEIDYTGILQVTDPNSFKRLLFDGIGKCKAFGCGLLLVKRNQ